MSEFHYLESKLKPIPAHWQELHKDALADARLPDDWPFDVALPQNWLDQKAGGNDETYWRILHRTVWIYPPGALFGLACDLVEGKIYV